jgi:cell division protein FtsL
MNRRIKPVKPASKLVPSVLALATVLIGFATLMVRLEVTEEGYRLSELQTGIASQQEHNRRLKLEAAQLGSHQRLRALAARYHLVAPQRGQVVMLP